MIVFPYKKSYTSPIYCWRTFAKSLNIPSYFLRWKSHDWCDFLEDETQCRDCFEIVCQYTKSLLQKKARDGILKKMDFLFKHMSYSCHMYFTLALYEIVNWRGILVQHHRWWRCVSFGIPITPFETIANINTYTNYIHLAFPMTRKSQMYVVCICERQRELLENFYWMERSEKYWDNFPFYWDTR